MQYLRVDENGVVKEVIPEIDETFPNLPIESRYPAAFVSALIAVPDSVEVTLEYVYDVNSQTFSQPIYDVSAEPDAEPEPTAQDDTDAMLVDHEYRITLLELGVTE